MDLHISLTDEDPVEGVIIAAEDRPPIAFKGWLDLLGILQRLMSAEQSTAD